MSSPSFPSEFRDLETFADWALETEEERSAKRQSCTYEQLQEVYDGLLARIDDILGYLDKFPLEDLSADAERLLWLSFSLAEVAPAIEQFGQVQVVEGYDIERFSMRRT